MAIELKVPEAGESIQEVQVAVWLKAEGDAVALDEPVVEIETDKASMELVAPAAGRLARIVKQAGERARPGEVIGVIDEAAVAAATTAAAPHLMPAARRVLAESGIAPASVTGTGKGGRILKEDALRAPSPSSSPLPIPFTSSSPSSSSLPDRHEDIRPLSLIRQRIAQRLVQARRDTALLTTFNEIDMSEVAAIRKSHREDFEKRHEVKLGLMSFFVRAAVDALARVPEINAEIRGQDVAYRDYCDIGVAVGGGRGLVVPVLRNAERMGFAAIERAIADLALRAAEGKLRPDELEGGTFTISNGGVYGSLLSTPIVNPPQTAILGLHAIQDRPVASSGQVVIRPMMYVALTYDHRLVDGREAVSFLRRIKDAIESPVRLLLEA